MLQKWKTKQEMCTTCVTAKDIKIAKKCIFHYCSKQMLEFLLNTLKNNKKKKITGVYRRHRRVNMQNKRETDGSSELFYGFALHQ